MLQFAEGETDRVVLVRRARDLLARLHGDQRAALEDAFLRVGHDLLASAEPVQVESGWARRTWPRRRYPQQCYAKTTRYILDHPEIDGMRLVHGVISHAPWFVPFDHAWVELPGNVVFDGVVQTFFAHVSYYAVMSAMVVDTYSGAEARQLVRTHRHPGPWNANWVPTLAQLATYAAALEVPQDAWDMRAGATPGPTPEPWSRRTRHIGAVVAPPLIPRSSARTRSKQGETGAERPAVEPLSPGRMVHRGPGYSSRAISASVVQAVEMNRARR
jgi:hypothetical protein